MHKSIGYLILRHLTVALLFSGSVGFAANLETGVATTGVNFRASPNGKIITGVYKGESFEILSTHGSWTRVRLAGGRKGYIFGRYVKRSRPHVPETEGGYCQNCSRKNVPAKNKFNPTETIKKWISANGTSAQCVARKMLEGAHRVHANRYGGKRRGGGACGEAIRKGLNSAGIWAGGGIGHARDMIPGLKRMGFINIKTPSMTPDNAPAGTILVYGRALPGAKRCRGLGTIYGHIEIKESRNSFLYDGNLPVDIQKIFGARCRPLIGVMQMGATCPTCSASVKRTCGV